MKIEEQLKDQVLKLAAVQYLLWQQVPPEGLNWKAVEISFCYQLLGLSYKQKLSRFSLGMLLAMVKNLAKKYDLPSEAEKLRLLEKNFRLELNGKQFTVSDCTAVNKLLSEEGSRLRLCSGFYGKHKFFILGEATEKEVGGYLVYRFKKEVAVTPGCHLLMAAMVGGRNVFLRESSARFLFYQKWRGALSSKDKIKKATLGHFGIKTEKDFKGKSKKFMAAFMDNLFYHELNHSVTDDYFPDQSLHTLAEASTVLGSNLLNHLMEIFTDWLPGKASKSPLQVIFESQSLAHLTLYISDNWFYNSSFPEQHIFTSLGLAPMFRHIKRGKFDWQGLVREMTDQKNGSLLNLYRQAFLETAEGLKKIVEESEFTLSDRPINFRTVSAYLKNSLQEKNKVSSGPAFSATFWSNIFVYLKKFSPRGYQAAMDYLKAAEKKLEQEVSKRLGTEWKSLKTTLTLKANEVFADA